MGIWKVVGEVLQVGFGKIAGVILLVRLLMYSRFWVLTLRVGRRYKETTHSLPRNMGAHLAVPCV